MPTDFQQLQYTEVPSLHGAATLWRHCCGTEVLCLDTPDRENLFGIYFSTPPTDDTGVPHILEHTVLGGSHKFPLRDPFIELIKSSVATFINAMTYADFTIYPVCSCHEKDYFNLAEVYWDAVFHPLLTRESFQQEGWHYEINSKGNLEVNGIVFNEMSGAYGELENILERTVWKNLLPNTCLAFDSGGDPEAISKLTYEDFLAFYHNHYRPDQAKIILIGNIPMERKLKFISEKLRDVPVQAPCLAPVPPPFKPWKQPRTVREFFVPEAGSTEEGVLHLTWHIAHKISPELDLEMQLLDLILLGNASAPLTKALLDTGRCTNLVSCGFDDNSTHAIFQIGVRGCREEDFDMFHDLIFSCLKKVAEGIEPARIKAALRQLQLEHNIISSDYTLDIMEDVLASWNGGGDPCLFLNQEEPWERLTTKLSIAKGYLGYLIHKYFLDNPHYLRVEMLSHERLIFNRNRRISSRLKKIQEAMSPSEFAKVRSDEKTLRLFQQREDSPKALAALPRLNKEDLSDIPQLLPSNKTVLPNQIPLLIGQIPTNKVFYFELAYDLTTLPQHLLESLPIFAAFFNQVGTARSNYSITAKRMAGAACSLQCGLTVSTPADGSPNFKPILYFSMQGLEEFLPTSINLLQEQLLTKSFHETLRLFTVARQFWSQLSSDLQSNSGTYATLRAEAGLTPAATLWNQWKGLPRCEKAYIWSEKLLRERRESSFSLDQIAAWLSTQTPIVASCTGGNTTVSRCAKFLEDFHPAEPAPKTVDFGIPPLENNRRDFKALNADVSCFAKAFSAPHFTEHGTAGVEVYAQLLSCGYLWQKIRLENGAYGVHCNYSPFQRTFTLLSNDDPNPEYTRRIFNELATSKETMNWSDLEINNGIIACCRGDERPWRPAQITRTALLNHLAGLTEEIRIQHRQKLLHQTRKSVKDAVHLLWKEYATQQNECRIGPK